MFNLQCSTKAISELSFFIRQTPLETFISHIAAIDDYPQVLSGSASITM